MRRKERHRPIEWYRSHADLIAPTLLEQDFTCNDPDQKWGVDISYIWTVDGRLYLAIVLVYSRGVLSDGLQVAGSKKIWH